MKKLMSVMLGLSLLVGTTAVAFGADKDTTKSTGKKKGKKKKSTDDKK